MIISITSEALAPAEVSALSFTFIETFAKRAKASKLPPDGTLVYKYKLKEVIYKDKL